MKCKARGHEGNVLVWNRKGTYRELSTQSYGYSTDRKSSNQLKRICKNQLPPEHDRDNHGLASGEPPVLPMICIPSGALLTTRMPTDPIAIPVIWYKEQDIFQSFEKLAFFSLKNVNPIHFCLYAKNKGSNVQPDRLRLLGLAAREKSCLFSANFFNAMSL